MDKVYVYQTDLLTIQSLKTEFVNHFEHSKKAKIPYKVELLVEAMNCRMIDFCESIDLLIRHNNVIPTTLLIRSLFEMLAIIDRVNSGIDDSLNESKLSEKFDELIMKLLLGTRYDTDYNAINILTQLEKINKKQDWVMKFYNDLSEFVHPNSDGVLGSYSELKENEHINLIYKVINNEHRVYEWFEKCYQLCMIFYYDSVQQIYSKLPDFTTLCENELIRDNAPRP